LRQDRLEVSPSHEGEGEVTGCWSGRGTVREDYLDVPAVAGETQVPCRSVLACCGARGGLSSRRLVHVNLTPSPLVIRPTPELQRLERRMARELAVPYPAALEIFQALWREAQELDPTFPGSGIRDLTAERAIARALNGLAPDA
jgi:hypothetical protein